jgi:putative transposase
LQRLALSEWTVSPGYAEAEAPGNFHHSEGLRPKEAELFQQIDKLQMEVEWLKKSLNCSDAGEHRKLVDHDHPDLTVSRQCELLGLPRSTLYYRPLPVRDSTLRIMTRIDAIYLEDPTAGSRRMVQYLARDGIPISRDRARNLMRHMGLRAIYRKPRTTVPGEPSERFPCLVDLQLVTAPDQAWATDITYIPLRKGFLYLVAVVDLFSRHVRSWKLSNSLDKEFCLEALEMALASGCKPQIFHSDQGCQFTSSAFVQRLKAEDIKISWSGRGRCFDNILVERLWRTHKSEEVYLRAYSDGWEAEISLARFFWRYGHVRPHSTLGGKMRSRMKLNPVPPARSYRCQGPELPKKRNPLEWTTYMTCQLSFQASLVLLSLISS